MLVSSNYHYAKGAEIHNSLSDGKLVRAISQNKLTILGMFGYIGNCKYCKDYNLDSSTNTEVCSSKHTCHD